MIDRGASSRRCRRFAFVGLIALAPFPALARTPGKEIVASNAASADLFGSAVSIDGDRILVGSLEDTKVGIAGTGSAVVFELAPNGAAIENQVLSAADAKAGDRFGCAVSVSGDRAIVGASMRDAPGLEDSGAAYVFERQANGTWLAVETLTSSEATAGDHFGTSVAISGDRAIVGAPRHFSASGAAYVFERQANGTWAEVVVLDASNGAALDFFGAVAIDGDVAVVGAPGHATGGMPVAGAAYVFERQANGAWVEQPMLSASDAFQFSDFGGAVAISGDRLLVGAWNHYLIPVGSAGAAYVFERQRNGTWVEKATLAGSDSEAGDGFGNTVALSGARALVGASGHSTGGVGDQGAAYVFEPNEFGIWTETVPLTAPVPMPTDVFGSAVAISGDHALVGAPQRDAGILFDCGTAIVFGLDDHCTLAWTDRPDATTPSTFKRLAATSGKKKLKLDAAFDVRELEVQLLQSDGMPLAGASLHVGVAGASEGTGHEPHAGVNWFHGWLFSAAKPTKLSALEKSLRARVVKLKAPGGAIGDSQLDLGGGVVGRGELDLVTDADGKARFRYVPGELASTDTIRVEAIDLEAPCAPLEAAVANGHAGLVALEPAPMGEWLLANDGSAFHASVWNGTPALLDALRDAAGEYHARQLDDPDLAALTTALTAQSYALPLDSLVVDAISLPMGGLLDADGDGACPVGGHRNGLEADVLANHLVTSVKDPAGIKDPRASGATNKLVQKARLRLFQLLRASLQANGLKVQIEGEHLHVVLKPE